MSEPTPNEIELAYEHNDLGLLRAIANRQKATIKELLEAAQRALNCLEDQVEGQYSTKDCLTRAISKAQEGNFK